VLVNNAATMCGPRDLTDDGFEWQLGVNYIGEFTAWFHYIVEYTAQYTRLDGGFKTY